MYFSAATNTYRAVNCDTNSFGVADATYGLAASPCRDCPAGMQTSTSLASSVAYWVSDGNGKQGFTSPMACVTLPGYGYNGRVASKCPAGSWNAGGNYAGCTSCPVGLSTADDASSQVSSSNCTVAVGFGFHNNVVMPCPVGECRSSRKTQQCCSLQTKVFCTLRLRPHCMMLLCRLSGRVPRECNSVRCQQALDTCLTVCLMLLKCRVVQRPAACKHHRPLQELCRPQPRAHDIPAWRPERG